MTDVNPVEIILDMIVGSVSDLKIDGNLPHSDTNLKPIMANTQSSDDLLTPIDASLSNLNVKKSFSKIFSFRKKKNSKDKIPVEISAFSNIDYRNTIKIYQALKKMLPTFKYSFSDSKNGSELVELQNAWTAFKKNNDSLNLDHGNGMPKNDNYNNHKERLQLFFNYIIEATKEFTEEEDLDLEMRLLKIIRAIKGKRDLKLHMRRYAAAMNLKDPLFFGDIRCNFN